MELFRQATFYLAELSRQIAFSKKKCKHAFQPRFPGYFNVEGPKYHLFSIYCGYIDKKLGVVRVLKHSVRLNSF